MPVRTARSLMTAGGNVWTCRTTMPLSSPMHQRQAIRTVTAPWGGNIRRRVWDGTAGRSRFPTLFVDENLSENSSISSGKIWWSVLNRERRGDYLGATVQIIPHITNEIKDRIYSMASDDVDVVITEIGGTVGDIESQPFLEAIRQVASERPHGDVVFIHVPLIVQIPVSVHPDDIVVIFLTVIAVGWLAVWYPVRYFAKRLL